MFNRFVFTAFIAAAGLFSYSPPAAAADHRDAPTVDEYSAIDINDVFMFRDPDNQKNLVMALSTQAIADPKFGPSYHFQANALYRFYFSTNAQAKPTASIDIVFSPFENGPSCLAPAAPCQTYRATFPHGITVEGLTTQGTADPTPLTPVITKENTGGGTITAFAGPREDPFFFDLIGFDRFVAKFNATGQADLGQFTGVDSFLGKNVNAIVLEFPISLVVGNVTKFSAWGVTYISDFRYHDRDGDRDRDAARTGPGAGGLRQIDRMGNPAINTALIPPPLKDAFNFGVPEDDAKDFASAIVASLTKFGTSKATIATLASVAVPDTLKFDTSEKDGYTQVPPNGRLLGDRVTDFLLGLILNNPGGISDGTKAKTYLAAFPYLGPPLQQPLQSAQSQ
ncbi:MAG TPA: DUF4331 family protein [Stellaceae bacterium]|nr:DUF4331 family protein [Stellaceae bacterium]